MKILGIGSDQQTIIISMGVYEFAKLAGIPQDEIYLQRLDKLVDNHKGELDIHKLYDKLITIEANENRMRAVRDSIDKLLGDRP